jgi:DNA-binding transcriptional ArsR family regulator
MAVNLRFPSARAIDLVGFAWSPLFEAVLSLRAVVHPKQTPMHLPWARRCRELPADLLEEIRALVGHFDNFVPGIFEVGYGGDSPAFDDELAAFEALDDDLVAYELSLAFGGIGCTPPEGYGPELVHDAAYRREVIAAVPADPQRTELAHAAFDDPGALRDRYARMLRRYWDAAFAEEWERLLPRIEAEVTAGAHALVTGGVPQLVTAMLPEGVWDGPTSSIVIEKDWDGDCDIAERGRLLLVPTIYGWPRVMIELAPPWPLSVSFPLRDLRQPAVPHASDAEVVEGFRALGDEVRLQIARLVAEHPRSTKELAALLSLSDSAISRHLKILESAGLVTSRRDGYFVLYGLQADRLDVLGRALRSTLGLTQSTSGDVPALPVSVPRAHAR